MGDALPRGLQHLKVTAPHKFVSRFSPRVMPKQRYVAPEHRLERVNIREGDQVRLMVGKPKEKYQNGRDTTDGYIVHTVHDVSLKTGRVYLKNVTTRKANPIMPVPANFNELSTQDQQQYTSQQNWLNLCRPIHYSNVQLMVDQRSKEDGGPVFASRVTTSAPVYDKKIGRYRYDRFASKLTSAQTTEYERDPKNGLVRIPWPKVNENKPRQGGPLDTSSFPARERTAELIGVDRIWEDPAAIPIGPSTRSRPLDLPRAYADRYIDEVTTGSASEQPPPEVDSIMPLYLSEELSPRFSRAKATKGWNLRRQAEKAERETYAREAVARWEAAGRDTGLDELVSELGLGDVKIRSRTRKEVREAAEGEYDTERVERGKIARMAKRAGGSFDAENDKWKVDVLPHIRRRRLTKMKKELRQERKLREMIV